MFRFMKYQHSLPYKGKLGGHTMVWKGGNGVYTQKYGRATWCQLHNFILRNIKGEVTDFTGALQPSHHLPNFLPTPFKSPLHRRNYHPTKNYLFLTWSIYLGPNSAEWKNLWYSIPSTQVFTLHQAIFTETLHHPTYTWMLKFNLQINNHWFIPYCTFLIKKS